MMAGIAVVGDNVTLRFVVIVNMRTVRMCVKANVDMGVRRCVTMVVRVRMRR
jgi:hypothetical protein